jgi:hypothetical protein
MTKKSGFVPKTFRDAGTGQEFEGGKSHLFETGAHDNYKTAGLITDPPAAKKTAPAAAKPKAGKKPAAKVAAPAAPSA